MRVLFVIAHLDKGGGQAVQCRQLFDRIRPKVDSAELIALTTRNGGHEPMNPDGTTIVGRLRFPGGLFDLRRALLARAERFDVVQAMDMYYALPAARMARSRPLVVRIGHDPVEDLASRWGTMGRASMRLVTPWLFSGIDTVVNSPHLALTVPSGTVHCIPNGVDVERFRAEPRPDDARAELGLPLGVPLIIFTGKVVPRKHLEDIFGLLLERPDLHFLLVGALVEPYYGDHYFKRLSQQYASVMDRVHAVGEVPMDRIPRYLEASDVFVFPSRLEGMPNSVLEAMAAGLPVALSENPAHQGLLPPGAGVVYRNPAELKAAMDELLTDPVRRRGAGRAGRAWVVERFSFDAAVGAYLALYRSLAG